MISIIVPIYNTESYLAQCIDSLLCQTEKDVQIILVDDQSTDDSLAIAQVYAQQDKRIEVYQQPHAGQSVARNYGLTFAKGEYIAFVDADDTIEPDWCERHLAAINGVDYVQSGYEREGKRFLPKHRCIFTSPWMRLYRREILNGRQFTAGMIYEDVVWSIQLWLSEATCRIIPYVGYHYRVNPHGTTYHPHYQERQVLYKTLQAIARSASFKGKCIVFYTYLRLKMHYLISDNRCSDK